MNLTQNELKELNFLSNDSGIDLKKFKLYFALFKIKTNMNIEEYVQLYMDLENEYSLFSDYIQKSGTLIEPDIRLFYSVFFIPNYGDSIKSQIKKFEAEHSNCKFLKKDFDEILITNQLLIIHSELQ
jgi:predicted phosphoadenosine phosphosulfate sulfurtransferase